VDVAGDFACITDYRYGLRIININPGDPEYLQEVGSLPLPEMTREVRVFGDYAYVTKRPHLGEGGRPALIIVNISNPASPVVEGTFELEAQAVNLDLADSGQYLFIPTSGSGIYVLDVTVKSNPIEVDRYYFLPYVSEVDVRGDRLYVDAYDQPRAVILDISDIHNAYEVSSCPLSRYPAFYGFEISGDMWVINSWYDALMIVDISNPLSPSEVGVYDETKGLVYYIGVDDGQALVALTKDGTDRLSSLAVSNLSEITEEATVDTPFVIYAMDVSDGFAYLAAWNQGLRVYDLSDPSNPVQVGACEEFHNARFVQVVGHYAYVADGGQGLRIVDISIPTEPRLVSTWDTPGYAWAVAVSGGYAYVSDLNGWSGLRVIDVTDPLNPWEVGSLQFDSDGLRQIAVSGNHAYIVKGYKELKVIDVSDPEAPFEVTSRETYYPSSYNALTTSGHLLFIADWLFGLRIMDISDPANPVQISVLHELYGPQQVLVKDNLIYVLNRDSGLFVLEYKRPE
jgi:hypothetical protein